MEKVLSITEIQEIADDMGAEPCLADLQDWECEDKSIGLHVLATDEDKVRYAITDAGNSYINYALTLYGRSS